MNADEPRNERPLEGWKEISVHLQRDERTLRRWEKTESLPIRRHRHEKRSTVFAYPSELDAWRSGRAPEQEPPSHAKTWVAGIAAALLLGVFLWFSRSAMGPVAEASPEGGVKIEEICDDCDWIGGISPDGSYLSETDWSSGDLGVRDLTTGKHRRITRKGSWGAGPGESMRSIFSPDGREIAFSWKLNEGDELRIVDAHDPRAEPRTVYANPNLPTIEPEAWTPDGELLVRGEHKDWTSIIGFVSIETGELRIVKTLPVNSNKPWLSLDGRWIAYDRPTGDGDPARDIYLIASDGSRETVITDHRANDFAMGFTRDGKTLLFASDRTGSYGLWGVTVDAQGNIGEPRLLHRDVGTVSPLGIGPDGALYYARSLGSIDLYTVNVDLQSGKLIDSPQMIGGVYQGSNESPVWSPDGARLIYAASPGTMRGGPGVAAVLVVRETAGGEERVLRPKGIRLSSYYGIRWSPDGRRVMLRATDERGRWNLYTVEIESGRAELLLREENQTRPIGWAPDGKTWFYNEQYIIAEGGEVEHAIVRVDPGESTGRRIYTSQSKLVSSGLAPDRTKILFRDLGPSALKVVSTEGGEARTLYQQGEKESTRGYPWTPDGTSVLFTSRGKFDGSNNLDQQNARGYFDATLWRVGLDGSPPTPIETPSKRIRNFDLHPNGKTLVYSAGEPDFRIFKMENYLPAAARGASE